MNILVIVLVFVIIMLMLNNNKIEGYSTNRVSNNSYGSVNPYYSFRAYSDEPYDYEKLDHYPYDYQQHEHPQRFNYYDPYFYRYGYGHL